jgi:uncharacterized repeat protein (TIGR01451 family)
MSGKSRRVCRLATCVALSFVFAIAGASVATAAVNGTVSGTVFVDYNANGVKDPGSSAATSASATDSGVRGATVTVTDRTGATVATTTTDATGAFTVNVAADSADVRVTVAAAGFESGPQGPNSATSVQFVSLGTPAATTIGVGLIHPGDYAPDAGTSLRVLTPTSYQPFAAATSATLMSSAYSDRGFAPPGTPPTTEATLADTGPIWGTTQLGGRWAFSAALFKRHTRLGPGGLGAIYLTDLNGAANAAAWVTIPNVGASPRGDESVIPQNSNVVPDWTHDVLGFENANKVGLGGVAMAADQHSIFVVNLTDRSLYRVPFTIGAGGAPVAGTPAQIALPLTLPGAAVGCDPTWVRPFGLGAQNGALWVTLTCTGPTVDDLRGYVYRYDLGTSSFGAAPAFELKLGNVPAGSYPRGSTGAVAANWQPWDDTITGFDVYGGATSRPSPLLSDVAFDSNGDMTIGIKDHYIDQMSANTPIPLQTANVGLQGWAGGETLRACRDATDTTWVLESNGICGTRTGANVANNQGPGGGEFYEDFTTAAGHQETTLGALLQLPGYAQIITTAFDPLSQIGTQGYRFMSNTNGNPDAAFQLNAASVTGGFGKSGSLGDMVALIGAAPQEIGNRVWFDPDRDGIQDPGEPAFAGVTVHLYAADGTTLLATAITDAGGSYYFSDAPGTTTASAIYAIPGFGPDSDYVIKLDNPADYATGGPLAGLAVTPTASGSDRSVDSNGTAVGGFAQAAAHTGSVGINDHTFDFGFSVPLPPVPPPPPIVPFVALPGVADVAVSKDVDKTSVDENAPLTWTVTVTNHGPGAATNVVTIDDPSLPVAFTKVSSSVGTCTDTSPVTCTLGTLADGASATIKLIGRARVTGELTNTARVSATPPDPKPSNNTDTAKTTVHGALKLTKTAQARTVRAGGKVRYTLKVTNPSMVGVRATKVCDALPSGLAYVSASRKAKRSKGRYCWDLGTIAAKSSKTIVLTTRTLAGAGGPLNNVATLQGSGIRAVSDNARVGVLGATARGGGVTG